MPIRFRCKYCNQLIGIARRKAGSDVSCPTCHGRLTVPEGVAAETEGRPRGAVAPFEQSHFEDFLRSPFGEEASRHAAASRARGIHPLPSVPLGVDVERMADESEPKPPAAGIVLSPVRLTVLVVIVILLLAAAFAAGIAVDRLFLVKSAG
jgi:phage FluMu protein Com